MRATLSNRKRRKVKSVSVITAGKECFKVRLEKAREATQALKCTRRAMNMIVEPLATECCDQSYRGDEGTREDRMKR